MTSSTLPARDLRDLMDPTAGPMRLLPYSKPGHFPSMLQGMPKVEDLAAAHKHRGPVPDPLGSIADDDDPPCPGRPSPTRVVAHTGERRWHRLPQATYQKAAHHRMASGRSFHRSLGNSSTPVLDILESAFLHRGKGGRNLLTLAPFVVAYGICMPNIHPSTLSTTTGGASWVDAPSLRLSA